MNRKYDEIYKVFFENKDIKNIKEKSHFFTPPEISQKIVEDLKKLNNKFEKESIKILDPSCGLGILTITLIKKIIELNVYNKAKIEIDMIDIDKNCVEKCKEVM